MILWVFALDLEPAALLRTLPVAGLVLELAAAVMIRPSAVPILELATAPGCQQLIDQVPGPPPIPAGAGLVLQNRRAGDIRGVKLILTGCSKTFSPIGLRLLKKCPVFILLLTVTSDISPWSSRLIQL